MIEWWIAKWMLVVAVAMLALCVGVGLGRTMRRAAKAIAAMRRSVAAALVALAVVCVGVADKNRGDSDGVDGSRVERVERVEETQTPKHSNTQTLSPADIARGWRVESVTTNATFGYHGEYSNVVEKVEWSIRGGRDMRFGLDLGGFVFPLGSNEVTRVCVLSGGTIWTMPPIRPRETIRAAEAWASFAPGTSHFWSADAESGAKLLTWENVFENSDGMGQFSAQIELRPNGDFVLRRDCVETVCRRVNPDDWDGDGLANDIDEDPLDWDGDFFGASAAWYNANCSGVMSATNDDFGNVVIEWNEGVCTNAYYWLDLSVTGGKGVSTVRLTCDGASDLGDMTIIARTNEVCRVPLLAGASYTVASDLPFAAIAASDARAEFSVVSVPGKDARTVALPLEFGFGAPQGECFRPLTTAPFGVGATLLSVTGACCACEAEGPGFYWSCDGGCTCGGGSHGLWATAAWEGYSRAFSWSGPCPCEGVPETHEASLVLDMPSVLFTNDNGGAEDSDIVELSAGLMCDVPTNGTLRLDVYNPELGIRVWSGSNRTGRVTFPLTWNVADCAMTNLHVEGFECMPTDVNYVSLEWLDGERPVDATTNWNFGVYCPIANVINSDLYDNGDLCNPSGIVVGTNACFAVEFQGFEPDAQGIVWSVAEGSASFAGGVNRGKSVRVASDVPDQRVRLRVQVGDCRSRPIEMDAFVVEPLSVKLTAWIVGNDAGSYYASDASTISNLVDGVNKIYEQIGVSFYIDSISYTNHTGWLDLRAEGSGACDLTTRRELVNLTQNSQGLELYFINRVDRRAKANHDSYGIVIGAGFTAKTVAHEIGHAFRCADIYHVKRAQEPTPLPDSTACRDRAPLDWNNGTRNRYYSPNVTQQDLVRRLLMCGTDYPDARDISAGSVFGYTKYGETGLVDVGMFTGGARRSIQLHR